jgi:hypothetical protein
MRLFPFAVIALVAASPGAAQSSPQPTIVLTIGGGVVTGHGLWSLDKQPLCLLNGSGACSGLYDTLRIARSILPSIIIGAAGTYFPWPHAGFHAEVSYVGFPIDDSCFPLFLNPDAPNNRAQQMCDNLSSASGTGSAISAFVGLTLRAAMRRAISPYARASVGVVNLSHSTTEVVGQFVDQNGARERQIINDVGGRGSSLLLGGAAGFTSPIGPGYQFRLEVRDLIASMARVTGPANDLAIAPAEKKFYHHIGLVLALDVVLERRRGRRY